MNNLAPLIVLGVVVLISIAISVVTNWLKAQQQAEQARAAERRAAARNNNAGNAGRPPASDIDRFLEEIDKLRKKSPDRAEAPAKPTPVARPPAVARPVPARPVSPPVVEPTPRKRVETVAYVPSQVSPSPKKQAAPKPPKTIEDLPVAPVLGPAPEISAAIARPISSIPTGTGPQKSDFAQKLSSLLNSGDAMPMAIVIQEIFGPPKAKRPPGG